MRRDPTVFGAYPNVLKAFIVLRLDKGKMFSSVNSGNVIVLSANAKKALFGKADPLNNYAKQEFKVIGTHRPLNPIITPRLVGLAVGISSVVGLIFGLWPAKRAAKKDPIEALRYE